MELDKGQYIQTKTHTDQQAEYESLLAGYENVYVANTADLEERIGNVYDKLQTGELLTTAEQIGISAEYLTAQYQNGVQFLIPEQPAPIPTYLIDLNVQPADFLQTVSDINAVRSNLQQSGIPSIAGGTTSEHYIAARGASEHGYVHLINPDGSLTFNNPSQIVTSKVRFFPNKQLEQAAKQQQPYGNIAIDPTNYKKMIEILAQTHQQFGKGRAEGQHQELIQKRHEFAGASKTLAAHLETAMNSHKWNGRGINYHEFMQVVNQQYLQMATENTWNYLPDIFDENVSQFLIQGVENPAAFFSFLQEECYEQDEQVQLKQVHRTESKAIAGYTTLKLAGVNESDAIFTDKDGTEFSYLQLQQDKVEFAGSRHINYWVMQSGYAGPIVKLEDGVAPWPDHIKLSKALQKLENNSSSRRMLMMPYAGPQLFIESMQHAQANPDQDTVAKYYTKLKSQAEADGRSILEFYM